MAMAETPAEAAPKSMAAAALVALAAVKIFRMMEVAAEAAKVSEFHDCSDTVQI
jgi:hypothetical protein